MNPNPFFPFGEVDPSKFDFTKMLGTAQLPGIDISALLAAQNRNIEALTQANKLALEGMQTLAKRQMEIWTQTMTEASKAIGNLNMTLDPRERAQVQTELTKRAFEQALANMRTLADLVQQANRDAVDVIGKRVADGLDELKQFVKK